MSFFGINAGALLFGMQYAHTRTIPEFSSSVASVANRIAFTDYDLR